MMKRVYLIFGVFIAFSLMAVSSRGKSTFYMKAHANISDEDSWSIALSYSRAALDRMPKILSSSSNRKNEMEFSNAPVEGKTPEAMPQVSNSRPAVSPAVIHTNTGSDHF